MSVSMGEGETKHTCMSSGRSSCAPCMQFETELWDAVNRYAFCVGGDPAKHTYGNVPRMQAVADVGKVVARTVSGGHEVVSLRAALIDVRDFLTSLLGRYELARDVQSLREDLHKEAEKLDHVLDETKEKPC